jgi:hypothetical protein
MNSTKYFLIYLAYKNQMAFEANAKMCLFDRAKFGFSCKGLFLVLCTLPGTLVTTAERLLALTIPVATHKIQWLPHFAVDHISICAKRDFTLASPRV